MAPAVWSRCSASVVLPEPAWPARTTLRRRESSSCSTRGPPPSGSGWVGGDLWAGLVPRADRAGRGRPSYRIAAMSGHSKWSSIKRQKGANDAKRGAVFTKVAREISDRGARRRPGPGGQLPAAPGGREGALGEHARGQHQARHRARHAAATRPTQFEEIVYEGYGPGGVAILVETATDNRNRTAADVRSLFTKSGGQLAGAGSVAWQFEPRGLVSVPGTARTPTRSRCSPSTRARSDVDTDADPVEIDDLAGRPGGRARGARGCGVEVESAELTMQAKATVEIDVDQARQNLRLIETLEDHDDVQRVTANFDLPDEILAEACRRRDRAGDRPRHRMDRLRHRRPARAAALTHGRLRLPRDHPRPAAARRGCCSSTRRRPTSSQTHRPEAGGRSSGCSSTATSRPRSRSGRRGASSCSPPRSMACRSWSTDRTR